MTTAGTFMTLTFERTFEDWVAYNLRTIGQIPSQQRGRSRNRLWLAAGAILFAVLAGLQLVVVHDLTTAATLFVAACFCALLAVWNLNAWYLRLTLRQMRDAGDLVELLGHWTTVFEDDKFTSKTDRVEFAVKWDAVHDVIISPHHIFIYINKIWGEIIPRRAFASPAEEQRLIEFLGAKTSRQIA